MDAKTLSQAVNISLARAQRWAEGITKAAEYAELSTRLRMASFLAQVGHESASFQYVRELGNPSYLSKYEWRKDLGNIQPGDGVKFCGRGLIQITGRFNYAECSQALFGDDRLLKTPDLLEQPEWAAKSAAWFWKKNGLNKLADADRFTDLSKRINGGTNGLEDRKARYKLALSVLK